jgi:hypothetical protein
VVAGSSFAGGLFEKVVADWEEGFRVCIGIGVIDIVLSNVNALAFHESTKKPPYLDQRIKDLFKVLELSIVEWVDTHLRGEAPFGFPECLDGLVMLGLYMEGIA